MGKGGETRQRGGRNVQTWRRGKGLHERGIPGLIYPQWAATYKKGNRKALRDVVKTFDKDNEGNREPAVDGTWGARESGRDAITRIQTGKRELLVLNDYGEKNAKRR